MHEPPKSVASQPSLSHTVQSYVGGAVVKYDDGRESMAFMLDCSAWLTSCLVLGHLSVSWMLRDIVPGDRQALLTVQVTKHHSRTTTSTSS